MSSSLEATTRTLSLQARSVAYLERHRIYELFHELATELVIKRPDDPFIFIKQHLDRIAKKRDVSRIILIAPPNFDTMRLANVLKGELQIRILTMRDLLTTQKSSSEDLCKCEDSEEMALNMKKIVESSVTNNPGWILVGIPRTKNEARIFQRFGIIPTHVFVIKESSCGCDELEGHLSAQASNTPTTITVSSSVSTKYSDSHDYKKTLRGLREAYANSITDIEMGIRTIEELGKDCAKLAKRRQHYGAPSLFRIILIGSRGSGCTTQAKYLAKRFDIIHIDFDYISQQARLQQTALGEMLRLCECKLGEPPRPEVRVEIIEKYVSRYECLKKGWIITGYPKTVEDFKLLDLIPTPPNRIIFMIVERETCKQRLINRRYNTSTGSLHLVSSGGHPKMIDSNLAIHPRDSESIVERDLDEYDKNMTSMMEYAGGTAFQIDGNREERTVREQLECCLICPTPPVKPRMVRPLSPTLNLKDVEFKPDDELSSEPYTY